MKKTFGKNKEGKGKFFVPGKKKGKDWLVRSACWKPEKERRGEKGLRGDGKNELEGA